MMALGHINSIREGRQIVRTSFDVETYEPQGGDEWQDAYDRFLQVTEVAP